MKVGDLFSGIGGFSLGLNWAGFETSWFVESSEFCQKVLEKHTPIYDDIQSFIRLSKGVKIDSPDIITGGPPCQPFSRAGERKGEKDDRDLWSEMLEVVKTHRPDWVIYENVDGAVDMVVDLVIHDLESAGYSTQPFIIPACSLGAFHRRDRTFIIASLSNSKTKRLERPDSTWKTRSKRRSVQLSRRHSKSAKRGVGGGADGISERLEQSSHLNELKQGPTVHHKGKSADHIERLKALGNAVLPQIPFVIGTLIKNIENKEKSNER